MSEDKQEEILKELKRRAEETRFGTLVVELKIHEGKIAAGTIKEKEVKLG